MVGHPSLVNNIYQLTAALELIYIDPPFNSNRNYEVFWDETKEKPAFDDRHASTQGLYRLYASAASSSCIPLATVAVHRSWRRICLYNHRGKCLKIV
jgi:hypothetical protein